MSVSTTAPAGPTPASSGHDHGVGAGHGHHHHHALGPPPPGAILSARGISLARGGRSILDHIDLDLVERQIVTLIGPNGAGKTTLVRLLLGLERADSGSVALKPGIVVGYVPQRFERDPAIPMTVTRFLELGRGAPRSRIMSALDEVGAAHVATRQLDQLSGGELQRVVLARALVRDPALLVLDEPARGVDHLGEADLYALIGRLRDTRGLSVLLVSHDLHVVMAQSDRVVCINRHVCCAGVPETVAQHPEYIRLFGDAARAFAIYTHHHDHAHGLGGEPLDEGHAEPPLDPLTGADA